MSLSLRRSHFLIIAAALGIVAGLVLYGLLSPAAGSANPIGGFTRVEAGGYATCGITSSGGLKCWGADDFGQLTDGFACNPFCTTPVDSSFFTSGIVDIALGEEHTCVLTSSGAVQCVGDNVSSQLGDSGACGAECHTPVNVSGLSSGVTAIAAGGDTSCAVLADGSVQCWGYGYGSPTVVSGISNATDIAVGEIHRCALTATGGIKCWGSNGSGQLGDGQACGSVCTTPVDVTGLTSGVAAVSVGSGFSCAVTTGDGAKCWGRAGAGQLGAPAPSFCDPPANTVPCAKTPVDVTGLTSGVTGIDAGAAAACVRTSAGGAKCWGNNSSGELGDGTLTNRLTPVNVIGLGSGVAQVTTAEAIFTAHSCALLSSGQIKCWGENVYGQVGDGQACGFMCTSPSTVSTIKPTPTPTPCGAGGCPTPASQLDFSIGIDTNHDGNDDCSTAAGGAPKCFVAPGALFRVNFYLNGLPPGITNYLGYDGYLTFIGVTPDGIINFQPWPDCALPATTILNFVGFGCAIFAPPPSTYLGEMAEVEFTCAASGSVTMSHNIGATDLAAGAFGSATLHNETPGAPETLNVNCTGAPPPTPTSTPQAVGGLSLDPRLGGAPDASDRAALAATLLVLILVLVGGVVGLARLRRSFP